MSQGNREVQRGIRRRVSVPSKRALSVFSLAAALLALTATALSVYGGGSAAGARSATVGRPPPNFLIILVDDQATNTFKRAYMPRTFNHVVDHGTRFRNGLAAPPLCCPDRAGILTGQYPHNHGVYSNDPGYAGLRDPQNTLPVWLQRAGYRTGFVGKFLNHYTEIEGAIPAPGFEHWFAFMGFPGYYGYDISEDGQVRHFGYRRSDYSTDVLTRKANRFVRRSSRSSEPFFLWLAHEAPHGWRSPFYPCRRPATPAPPTRAAVRAVRHVPLPRPPSFNERDVSDKPAAIRNLPRLNRRTIERIEDNWHCTLAAVAELDKGIGRMMRELERDGERRHTIIFYVSDNGFFFGEHRRARGKSDVYEPALNVPYVVKVPRAYRRRQRDPSRAAAVSNQDIAATTVDYAARYIPSVDTCAAPGECRRMDGRSLAPLLGGPGRWPHGRGVLAEIDADGHDYAAIRTPRYVYSQLASGERELYDLEADPHELQNQFGISASAAIQQRLAARLALLRSCSGIRERDAPSARPFCE